jgi:hypothetical protein
MRIVIVFLFGASAIQGKLILSMSDFPNAVTVVAPTNQHPTFGAQKVDEDRKKS